MIEGADLTFSQGRPPTMETDERTSSTGPTGVMAMACRHRRPDAGSPSGDRGWINWQLARDRPDRVGWRRGS